MPLIQVTSGGQRSLLKKKLQVCESQQSCLFVGDQILIFHHNLQINYLKILQCDFQDFFSYFVSHSWGIPMMKITGLSHLFKWENLHNWWLTKYFFAPLYNNWFPANGLLKMNGHSKCMASTVKLGNWFVIIHQPETIITYITDTAGLFLSSTYTYTTQTFLGPFQCTQSFAHKTTPTMPHKIHFLTRKRCHVFARNWWAVLSTATTKNTTQWRKKINACAVLYSNGVYKRYSYIWTN